jgi:hypothetical protein
MNSNEPKQADRRIIQEWLNAMDRVEENNSRFPRINVSNGSPAEEFADDPDGYWERAKAIAWELSTFGGIKVSMARPSFRTDASEPIESICWNRKQR